MGEARRKRFAREADYAMGQAVPRPGTCPACGSKQIGHITPGPDQPKEIRNVEHGVCADCRAIWEAFPPLYVEDGVCAEPCDNCAFRPGSPEQGDPEKWKALIATLKPDQSYGHFTGRFYCHKHVPIDMTKGPGNFLFPQRPLDAGDLTLPEPTMVPDTSKMRTCSGFLRMFWAQNAKRESKGTTDEPDPRPQ
jgi:hypothetical protein